MCAFYQLNTIHRKNSPENAERTFKPNIYNHLSVNAATGIWINLQKTTDSLQRLKQHVSYDYTKTSLLRVSEQSRGTVELKNSEFSR